MIANVAKIWKDLMGALSPAPNPLHGREDIASKEDFDTWMKEPGNKKAFTNYMRELIPDASGILKPVAAAKWMKRLGSVYEKGLDKAFTQNLQLTQETHKKITAIMQRNAAKGLISITKTPQKELSRIKQVSPFATTEGLHGSYSHKKPNISTVTPRISLNILNPGKEGIGGTFTHELTHARQFDFGPRTYNKISGLDDPEAILNTVLLDERALQKTLFKSAGETPNAFYTNYDPVEALARQVSKSPIEEFDRAYSKSMLDFMMILDVYRSGGRNAEKLISWERELNF